jgi:hypothetical protein
LSKNLKHTENDYYDDNDDQDDFDAYLQEYVSKYEMKEEEKLGDELEKNEIIKAKRHHSHNHHRRRHHHKHHHRHRHHHDHHRHRHHNESCQRYHSNKIVKSNKNKNLNNLVSLFRPMITESSSHCRLFEIDNQVNAGLKPKSKSSTKNTQYSRCTCRKSNLKEDSCSIGKNENQHHHHRRRKNKHDLSEEVDKFPFEQQRAKTSKKRKLKKEKFGKSEEHLEIKASINKSSKLDDSASNLSYTSLTSKKGN